MAKVYMFLADGFEEVEGLTVVDLLRRAEIEVVMTSIMGRQEVTGTNGITVKADRLFEDVNVSDADMLVLPGGQPGTTNLGAHRPLAELLLNGIQKAAGWLRSVLRLRYLVVLDCSKERKLPVIRDVKMDWTGRIRPKNVL